MKILFMGETASIHVARWVNQLHGTGWDYRIFHPSIFVSSVRDEFLSGYFYLPHEVPEKPSGLQAEYTISLKKPSAWIVRKVNKQLDKFGFPIISNEGKHHEPLRIAFLAKLIQEWQPDVIHSLGMFVNWHNNSKMLLGARRILGRKLPCPWIVSTWGADLDLYPYMGRKQWAEAKSVMSACDGMIIEGERDLALAQKLGFHGRVLAKLPAFGGITWKKQDYCSQAPSSSRRVILLKGRDNTDPVNEGGDPQGRAMTAIKAFEMCQELLQSYSIVITQATPSVEKQAMLLAKSAGLNITVYPSIKSMPYEQWLKLLGSARIMIAITVSDGLPSTLVEAMSLGVFPVHSGLETIGEWIQDGQNGLLVAPEDVQGVYQALCNALTNDLLVDKAGELNVKIVNEKLSADVVRPHVLELYRTVGLTSS